MRNGCRKVLFQSEGKPSKEKLKKSRVKKSTSPFLVCMKKSIKKTTTKDENGLSDIRDRC